jgi:hypothetical protein
MYFERMIRSQIERYNTRRAEAIRVRDESRVPHLRRSERPGPKTPIRIGVAGSGKYAQHHLKAFAAYEGVEFAALLTTGGPAAAETAAAFGFPAGFTDPDDFLALDVDCYLVVTAPGLPPDVAERGAHNEALRTRRCSSTTRGVFGAVMDLWDTPDRIRLHVISEDGRLELAAPRQGLIKARRAGTGPDRPYRRRFPRDVGSGSVLRRGRSGGTAARVPAATLQDSLGTMQPWSRS